MRRTSSARWVAVRAAAVASAVAAAGCGSSSAAGAHHVSAPGHPGTTAPPPGSTGPSTPTTAPPAHHVGAAVALTGPAGLSAVVQVAAVVDPATPAASYDQAGTGLRYAAAKLAVRNSGAAPLHTNLLDDITVTDGIGGPVSPVVLDMANCPVIFGGDVTVAPATVTVGCVAFELPAGAPVTAVQVQLAPPPGGQATWANP